jgi:hypothetical protein
MFHESAVRSILNLYVLPFTTVIAGLGETPSTANCPADSVMS